MSVPVALGLYRAPCALGLYRAPWSVPAIGGNTVALPDVHRATVGGRGWITDARFVASFALARAALGPNGMASVPIGPDGRNPGSPEAAGLSGAFTAAVAKSAPSSPIAHHGAAWFGRRRDVPGVAAMRRGLAPVTVGPISAAGFVLERAAGGHDRDAGWTRRGRRGGRVPRRVESAPADRRRRGARAAGRGRGMGAVPMPRGRG